MTLTEYVLAGIVLILLAIGAGQGVDRRRRRRNTGGPSGADVLLAGTEFTARVPASLLAAVLLATIFSAIAAGLLVGNRVNQPARDRADQATNHYQRCTNRVSGQFRKAVDVFLIGYSVTDPAELNQVARELHLPADADAVKAEGRARVVASYIDDLRLDSTINRLCPYVPGHPELTPENPVGSATDALDRRLAHLPPPTTTTTTTTPGAHHP